MKLTAKKEDKELLKVYSENELQLTAEVLVIGGGPAAAWAAWAAASQGVKVIIVDKGFLGTSGAAAASGNGIMAPSPENWDKVLWERYRIGKNLANLRWIERVIEKTWLSLPLVEDWAIVSPKKMGNLCARVIMVLNICGYFAKTSCVSVFRFLTKVLL